MSRFGSRPVALAIGLACSACLAPAFLRAEDLDLSKPVALAEESFDCFRECRFDDYAKLVRDEDKEMFKEFLVTMWEMSEQEGKEDQIATLLDVESREEVDKAEPERLFVAFMNATVGSKPEVREALKSAKFEAMGAVAETDDLVHVVARSLLGQAELVPCYRQDDGEWKIGLKGDLRNRAAMFRRVADMRKAGKSAAEITALVSQAKVLKGTLIGIVRDDEETVRAVVRAVSDIAGAQEENVGVYPIRKGEPAWLELDANDPTSVADADRRARIEAALVEKWNPSSK